MVGLSNQVSGIDGVLWVFIGWNQPKDAVLLIEDNPLQLNSKRSFVRGHLEVNHQLPDGILYPSMF
jgi:hypothetical protein